MAEKRQQSNEPNQAQSRQTRAYRNRLKLARQTLQEANVRSLQGRVDELEARLAARVSPAKLTAADGSLEAVVLFGLWLRDDMAGEEGPGICYRVGSSAPAMTLLAESAEDEAGPDIATGDHIRIRRLGNRRHSFLGVIRPAAKRDRIDWMAQWRQVNAPNVRALDVAGGAA